MLSLTEKFERDIQQNHSTVYPLIIIDNQYYISTIEETILSNDEPLKFKDYGLKISNIKESIDVQSHSFKISNVTLTLNNYEQNGLRVSDILSDKINKSVEVYYKTQSCQTLEDCLLAYKGIIKRNTHDESTLSITLEDLTDTKLHKDVPVANLGFNRNVYNKNYINEPIPITYGSVSKAPVVLWVDNTGGTGLTNLSIIADDVENVTKSERNIQIYDFNTNEQRPELNFENEENKNNSFLYIYKDDYLRVLQTLNHDVETLSSTENTISSFYTDYKQYEIDSSGQYIFVEKIYKGGFPQNPPAMNEFQTVNIIRPNQSELTISESGVAEQGNVGSIINIESTILRSEAAIDSADNPTVFFNTGEQSEFDTFAQIPNNQPTISNTDYNLDRLEVNLFSNFNNAFDQKGIYYPQDNIMPENTHSYLLLANAWLQTNAHQANVKFINMPTGDMIVTAADTFTKLNGYRPSPSDIYLNNLTYEESGYSNTQIFKVYQDSSNESKVKILTQDILSDNFQTTFWQSCGRDNPPSTDYNYGIYFRKNQWNGQLYNHKTFYPTTCYKIPCIPRFNENNEIINPQNLLDIDFIYVGQWNPNTMSTQDLVNDKAIWINIFSDESDFPSLFDINNFATFTPFELRDKHRNGNFIGTGYGSYWNGVSITENINESSNKISNQEYYAHDNGLYNDTIKQNKISYNLENTQGQSWFMMIIEPITEGSVLKNISESTDSYMGEYIDDESRMEISKGTLIPCNHQYSNYLIGENYNYDYSFIDNPETVNLTVGNDQGVAEQRLSLFFPFSDIPSTDAIQGETKTFVYGALELNIPTEIGTNETHKVSDTDNLLVQAYATDSLDEENLDFNSEFVGESGELYTRNLINLDGNNTIFTDGGDINWNVNTFDDENNDTINTFSNFKDFIINDWSSPDEYNALSLVYRLRNDSPDTTSRVQISTNIKSIALLQYSIYENVFSDQLYADIKGRADIEEESIGNFLKYTNFEIDPNDDTYISQLIENPADVLYHFVEKELGVIDKTDRDSWISARTNSDIKLAFSVNEKTNSKSLIQNIAKNTKLFPKFNSSGDFSYSYIQNEYGAINEEIKQKDVIDFQFTRTPSENIKTLVKVKYKKDYAADKYTRETGYCDGYDFFGNSENGAEVYKKNTDGEQVWDSNGYDYSYLGIERESNIFEFESNYIRDYESAIELRNYIYLLNCNQHTIIKCTLPLKYIKLEAGDVVKFDSLYNNVKAFGEDYTQENTRNGQLIYPFFIITSVTKSSKNIKIECMQLHKLKGDFNAGKGSVSRRSELGINSFDLIYDENGYVTDAEEYLINGHITLEDKSIIENYVAGSNKYLTSNQILLADLSDDGSIDGYDVNILNVILNATTFQLGDINEDGEINIADVVTLIEYIIGDGSLTNSQLLAADLTEDGIVNITDMINLINNILGD